MGTQATVELTQQYLTFHIAGEEYAIGITRVREIIEYETVTRVPKMPAFIRGVINLRGAVVPVIDLAVKFGLRNPWWRGPHALSCWRLRYMEMKPRWG